MTRTRSRISSSRRGWRSSSGARARRGAARARRERELSEPRTTRRRSSGCSPTRVEVARDEFRVPMARRPRLEAVDPDPRLYPNFDKDLRAAFGGRWSCSSTASCATRSERRRVAHGPYTYVNERLARHYGIGGVRGDQFRRVELEDPNRWGVFGKGSVLMATSYPDRTSPVLRGAWVMEHLLGTPPTPAAGRRRNQLDARVARDNRNRFANALRCIGPSPRAIIAMASSIRSVRRSRTTTRSASGACASAKAASRSIRAAARGRPASQEPRGFA